LTTKQKLKQLDLVGEMFLFPSIISLLLALQWGGSTYSWIDGKIIGLFVVFAVCLIGFILVQIFMQGSATIPGRVIKNRSILSALWLAFCNGAFLTTVIYYVPVWFQAIKVSSFNVEETSNADLYLGQLSQDFRSPPHSSGLVTHRRQSPRWRSDEEGRLLHAVLHG
jgi:hypothetical protein